MELGVRPSTFISVSIFSIEIQCALCMTFFGVYFQFQLLRETKWKMLATPNPNDTFVTIFLYEGFPCTFYPLCYISTKDVFGSFIWRIVFTSFTAKRAKTQANNIEKNLQFINLSTYYREIYVDPFMNCKFFSMIFACVFALFAVNDVNTILHINGPNTSLVEM